MGKGEGGGGKESGEGEREGEGVTQTHRHTDAQVAQPAQEGKHSFNNRARQPVQGDTEHQPPLPPPLPPSPLPLDGSGGGEADPLYPASLTRGPV